jgi:hypothetical protein
MARVPSHPALADGAHPFPHEHLLGIAQLKPWEIAFLLDEAEQWVDMNRARTAKRDDRLAGLTQINAFFENSTRTLLSFEIAGKRLGADVVNLGVSGSSLKKGETLLDTALTLNAMHPDMIVIRHGSSGAVQLISEKVDCPVLNAGDGRHLQRVDQSRPQVLALQQAFIPFERESLPGGAETREVERVEDQHADGQIEKRQHEPGRDHRQTAGFHKVKAEMLKC